LAEEVADEAGVPSNRDLARHLYGLAAALDQDRLARSACLALADLADDEQAKRRLRALASLLGSDGEFAIEGGESVGHSFSQFSSEAIIAFTEAISRYRKGQGAQAAAALRKPGADELLKSCDRWLPGGYNRFQEVIKQSRGQTRPTLSASDQLRLLHLEAAVLAGIDRTWSSELLVTRGSPLIEVDPSRLAETLEVDDGRPFYRNGRWVER
jgi:hypothetical protein